MTAPRDLEPHPEADHITLRSVIIGLLVAVVVTWLQIRWQVQESSLRGASLVFTNMPGGAIFPLLLCLVIFNLGLGRLWPRLRLRRAELILITILGLVATTVPLFIVEWGYSMISGIDYFGQSNPLWQDEVLPYIETWLYPADHNQAVTWLYEGAPEGASVDWSVFTRPAIAWGILLALVSCGVLFMMSLIRRRWVEEERLTYPLLAVPLLCIDAGTRGEKRSMFWSPGFLLALLPGVVPAIFAVLHAYNNRIPALFQLRYNRSMWPWLTTNFVISPRVLLTVAVAYFVPTRVALSIWSLHLATAFEAGTLKRWGSGFSGGSSHFIWSPTSVSWQTYGGFVVYCLWALWLGRRHLTAIVRKSFGRPSAVDDSEEFIPYRLAFFGLIFCVIGYILWLILSGMSWGIAILFALLVFLIFFGIGKIIAQTGLLFFTPPGMPQHTVLNGIGSQYLSASTVTATGMQFSWFGDVQSTFAAACTHAFRLARPVSRRWVVAALMLGVLLICIPLATLQMTDNAYEVGGLNFQSNPMRVGAEVPLQIMHRHIKHPQGPDWKRWTFFGIGAALMLGASLMHYRFVWWPLHPVGFAVASTWPVRTIWVGFAIAWLAKVLLLKVGGARVYKKAMPIFLGLAVGAYLGEGIRVVATLVI